MALPGQYRIQSEFRLKHTYYARKLLLVAISIQQVQCTYLINLLQKYIKNMYGIWYR